MTATDPPLTHEQRIAAWIEAKVAEAPPLSDRQRAIIGAAFATSTSSEEDQRHAS